MSERLPENVEQAVKEIQLRWELDRALKEAAHVDLENAQQRIDALESENAELRRKVEAAEALSSVVERITTETYILDEDDCFPIETWWRVIVMLMDAHNAFRATATDEGG